MKILFHIALVLGSLAVGQAPSASIKEDRALILGMWQRVPAKGDDGKTDREIRLDFRDDVLAIRHVMDEKERFLLEPFELKEVEGKRVIFLDKRKWASYRLAPGKLVLEDGTLDLPGGAVSLQGEWKRSQRLEDATVQKAIKAHGGPAAIKKLRIARVAFSLQGSFPFLAGADKVDIKVEETYQLPRHQIKKVITGKADGKDIALTWAIDGDRHWHQEKGGQTEVMDERLDTESQYRPFLMLERMVDRDTRWRIPEEFAKQPGRIALRATSMSTRLEATYSFDEATGLLASIQTQALPPGQLGASQEWKLSDYREIDGVTLPMKQVLSQDGKRLAEIRVREVRFFDKLDLEIFAAPR